MLTLPFGPITPFRKEKTMKTKIYRIPQFVLLSTLLLISVLAILGEDSTAELGSYDAIVADPGHHRVVLENEKVRVLEVTIKPGEKEPFHVHLMPSVLSIITGAKLRITQATLEDGKILIGESIEVGKDNFQPPPLWMAPQTLHSAENIGSATFHAYRIELKSGEGPNQTPEPTAATPP